MIQQHQAGQRRVYRRIAGRGIAVLPILLVAALAGCRHKSSPLVLPQISRAPIELESSPEPASPMVIATLPERTEITPAAPPALPPPKKPARRRAPPKDVQPPVQVAAAEPAASLAIGALTSGGDTTPQSQQEARELIVSIQKRLSALPGKTASQQKELVRQVRSFLKQAQQALDSGDAEGARNLATKAKLLMDDVEKK